LRLVFAYDGRFTYTQVPLYSSVADADVALPRHVAEQTVAKLVDRAAELGAAGVVVGVDGSRRAQTVPEYGFDYASRHRLPLRAVLCWPPDLLA
jgi:isopentenyl diphosphate isomerase/L-lactate dehydrogenase-like FMN-dependent dehydrogenase